MSVAGDKPQVVVRRANGRFVRRIQARSGCHAKHLKKTLEETYDRTYSVTIEPSEVNER